MNVEHPDQAVMEALVAEMRDLPDCDVTFQPISLLHLVGLVQLALRHPGLPGGPREFGERFLAMARVHFAACPAVLDLIARGDDPTQDADIPDSET